MVKINSLSIRENRKKLGLSQTELADLMGVSRNTIYNYERGEDIPESKLALLNKVLFEPLGEETPVKSIAPNETDEDAVVMTVSPFDRALRETVKNEMDRELKEFKETVYKLFKRIITLEDELSKMKKANKKDSKGA